MTDHQDSQLATDQVAELIRAAGKRPVPPDEIYQRVRADAMTAYTQTIDRRLNRRRGLTALAAVLAAAVALVVVMNRPGEPAPQALASLLRTTGDLEIMRPGPRAQWSPLAAGESVALAQGTRLRTGSDGRAALRLLDEISLRMDADSSVSFISPRHLALHQGRVYIDAGDQPGNQIAVTTPAGVARDIGTRFEVQYLEPQMRLRIRDGRVEVSRDDGLTVADAGEQVSIDAAGAVQREQIAPDAPQWDWIEQIAFAPEIDGRPVRVLLDWVARETGKTLKFSDASVENEVDTTLLHGDISLLRPMQALSVMLATTDFGFALSDNGEIEVWSKTRQ